MAAPFMNKLSQLYRDPDRGWLFGVVAGLCQTFGWRVRLTRVILIILAVFFGLFGVLAVACALLVRSEWTASQAKRRIARRRSKAVDSISKRWVCPRWRRISDSRASSAITSR